MRFVKEIRESLGLNQYQMAHKMGLEPMQRYVGVEESTKAIRITNLVRLWELSGLSPRAFMEMLKAEADEMEGE